MRFREDAMLCRSARVPLLPASFSLRTSILFRRGCCAAMLVLLDLTEQRSHQMTDRHLAVCGEPSLIIRREQGTSPFGGVLDADQPRALTTCEGGRPMYVRVDGYTVFQNGSLPCSPR